jgi:hypothetical protein
MAVGVVVERRRIDNPWQDVAWRPVAVVPGAPALAPWSVMREDAGATQFFAGVAEIALHPNETENYAYNLEMAAPAVYVTLRPDPAAAPFAIRLLQVTASPGEAEATMEGGADIVEKVPMPPDIGQWLTDFVAAHHVERRFFKRQRQRYDPEQAGVGRRPPRDQRADAAAPEKEDGDGAG